jgi:hypothetical protein
LNKGFLIVFLLLTILPYSGYIVYNNFDFSIVKSDLNKEKILDSIDGKSLYEEGYETKKYEIHKDSILEFEIENSNKEDKSYKTTGNLKAESENLIISGKFNLIHTYINGEWKVTTFSLEEMEKTPSSGPTEDEIKDMMSQKHSISLSEKVGGNSITLGDDAIQKISVDNRNSDIKNNNESIDFNMSVLKDLVTVSIKVNGNFVFNNEKWNLSEYKIDYESIAFKYNDENLNPPENEDDLKDFVSNKSVGIKHYMLVAIPKNFIKEKFSKFTITKMSYDKVGTNVIYKGYMAYDDEEFKYEGDYTLNMNCEENNEWKMEFELDSEKEFKTATSMQLLEKVIGINTEINGESVTIKEEYISDFEVEERNIIDDKQEIIVSFNYKYNSSIEFLKFKIMYYVDYFESVLEEPERVNQ